MTEKKRIFLLGGTGFVGSALTRQLVASRAENNLMMLIHRTAPFRDLEQVDTQTGSLGAFDLSLLDRFKPDTIVHLARMSGRGRWGRYFAALSGARANRRIIGHLEQGGHRPHVIYMSGTLVYGDCGDAAVDEGRALSPIAFAREYHRAEQPWEEAMQAGRLPVTILRPPWIVGGGSWFGEFYVKNIRQHGIVPLFGDGKNLMSLLDVEDCAGLAVHAVRNARPGRTYNLFAPAACLTQADFAAKLAELTGATIRRFDADETARRFDRSLWEAFTFSSRCATRYPEFMAGYSFHHPGVDDMIRNHLPAELRIHGGTIS